MPIGASEKRRIGQVGFTNQVGKAATPGLVRVLCLLILAGQAALLLAVGWQQSVPIERLFRDTVTVAEEYPGCCHVYDGMISNAGILLWWTAATLSAFTAILLSGMREKLPVILPYVAAAALTAWLALDDFFMIHETIIPELGLPQASAFIVYGLLITAYLAAFWRTALSASPVFALLAIAFLGTSAVADNIMDQDFGQLSAWLRQFPRLELLIEDGSKFLGIGAWLCLHFEAASSVLLPRLTSSRTLAFHDR